MQDVTAKIQHPHITQQTHKSARPSFSPDQLLHMYLKGKRVKSSGDSTLVSERAVAVVAAGEKKFISDNAPPLTCLVIDITYHTSPNVSSRALAAC